MGGEYNLNKLSDMVREECATCGFIECLNFVLCSMEENTKMLNRSD
jgi:phenylalanyl-tRNA synthetase beta chain